MALPVIEGKVWKFGDNINTDYMMPGFTRGETLQERASFCMRAIRPEFAKEVRPGDVIIAGKNYGCGSSRPAATNLITLGIGGVIAESFGRLFTRNSISLGFPLLTCKGVTAAFNEGDLVQANLKTGEIKNLTSGINISFAPLPDFAQEIINDGGLLEHIKKVKS